MISKNHNICIRKATSLDEEIIKNIWRESFHLPEDYLEHLFKSLYNVANAFILEDTLNLNFKERDVHLCRLAVLTVSL